MQPSKIDWKIIRAKRTDFSPQLFKKPWLTTLDNIIAFPSERKVWWQRPQVVLGRQQSQFLLCCFGFFSITSGFWVVQDTLMGHPWKAEPGITGGRNTYRSVHCGKHGWACIDDKKSVVWTRPISSALLSAAFSQGEIWNWFWNSESRQMWSFRGTFWYCLVPFLRFPDEVTHILRICFERKQSHKVQEPR